jgi:hypothetical protein
MNSKPNEETAISERVVVEHDDQILHIIYRDEPENFVSLDSDELLELVRYIFKNDLL